MRLIPAAVLSVGVLAAQTANGPARPRVESVTAVRHWSTGEVTRVAIEVTGEFEYRTDRLHNPERIYYDILNARPYIGNKRAYNAEISDKLVSRIRVAETVPGVTRVVLDLTGVAEATASQLTNPNRLIVELKAAPAVTEAPAVTMQAPKLDMPAAVAKVEDAPANIVPKAASPPARAEGTEKPAAVKVSKVEDAPKLVSRAADPTRAEGTEKPTAAKAPKVEDVPKPVAKAADPPPTRAEAAEKPAAKAPKVEDAPKPVAKPEAVLEKPAAAPDASAGAIKAARRTSAGETSLVRALGLKIGRVVIDAGHGGHDQGTESPKGLLEKDLVLDIALRVGKLVEDRMGAEVIYTRSDDTFIPLEGRTAIANEKKADLFLSIHANSSAMPRVGGVETFYLNFADSKDAMELASRENASSQKSVFELRDLISRITQHDKAEESREFASKVQASLQAFSARNFPGIKNRGVKKAPFVVLIGAHMPSVLAEIGFLTNPREEALLKKTDYRQKLAEALFKGLQGYASSLSHFQMAQAKE